MPANPTRLRKAGNYLRDYRRPLLASAYTIICIFDFLVMPTVIMTRTRTPLADTVKAATSFKDTQQALALTTLLNAQRWEPLTLRESGLFHMAMGAILTGAAVTRGLEKRYTPRADKEGS